MLILGILAMDSAHQSSRMMNTMMTRRNGQRQRGRRLVKSRFPQWWQQRRNALIRLHRHLRLTGIPQQPAQVQSMVMG